MKKSEARQLLDEYMTITVRTSRPPVDVDAIEDRVCEIVQTFRRAGLRRFVLNETLYDVGSLLITTFHLDELEEG